MEQRFEFIAPTPGEVTLSQRGKLLLPLAALACIGLNLIQWSNAYLKLGVGAVLSLAVVWLIIRLSDIQRREAQSTYGSVELTPQEIRVSLSERSLLRIQWHDFTGTELKNGWLQLRYRDLQFEQGGQTKRLDRIRLRELQNPDALQEALRTRTAALEYLKQ